MAEAAHTIHVDVVSAEGEIFSGSAEMVFAPGSEGELGIAPRHAPLLTLLKAGEVRIKTAEGEQSIFVGGGALEVQPNKVTILSGLADRKKGKHGLGNNPPCDKSEYLGGGRIQPLGVVDETKQVAL